jgi:hypothetical protein
VHAAGQFYLGKEGEGLLYAAGRPFGEEERSPSLSLHLYPLLNERVCLGVGYLWFLSLF